jgi:hypothetical protein
MLNHFARGDRSGVGCRSSSYPPINAAKTSRKAFSSGVSFRSAKSNSSSLAATRSNSRSLRNRLRQQNRRVKRPIIHGPPRHDHGFHRTGTAPSQTEVLESVRTPRSRLHLDPHRCNRVRPASHTWPSNPVTARRSASPPKPAWPPPYWPDEASDAMAAFQHVVQVAPIILHSGVASRSIRARAYQWSEFSVPTCTFTPSNSCGSCTNPA